MSAGQGSPGDIIKKRNGGKVQVFPSGTELLLESGASVDVESGGSLKLAGTAVTSTAAELNKLDGVTATGAELNQYFIEVVIPDISTAQSVFVVAPHAGDISTIYTVIDNAITVGDATITAEIGGTLVTGSSITIAQSGSAAGDVDSSTPSAANTVTAGQAIEIITDGGSTTACRATATIVIDR